MIHNDFIFQYFPLGEYYISISDKILKNVSSGKDFSEFVIDFNLFSDIITYEKADNIILSIDGCFRNVLSSGIANISIPLNKVMKCLYYKENNQKKGEEKMVITIIGSLSMTDEIKKIKDYFESFGCTVNSPGNEALQTQSLLKIQSDFIEKILESDLIVAVPKDILFEDHGESIHHLKIGESTSYEMAIAKKSNKPILYWHF